MPMKGYNKHKRRLQRLASAEVVRLAGAIAYEGADMVRAEAFRLVSAGSVSGKGHVPSAPNTPPNRDTGTLQAGFETQQTGATEAEFRSTADHAKPMEFGALVRNGFGKGLIFIVWQRPHVRPARDSQAPKIRKRFAEQMDKLVKRSG